jgi:hypothetical protein
MLNLDRRLATPLRLESHDGEGESHKVAGFSRRSVFLGGRRALRDRPASFVAGFLLAAVAMAALLLLTGLPSGSPSHRTGTSPTSSNLTSPSTGGWQAQTVRRGLEELGEPSNRGLPALVITKTVPEAMPQGMRRKVHETLGPAQSLQLDFDQAQLVRTQSGLGIWVVGGRGVTCIFRDGVGSSNCQTSVLARQRGLLLEVYKVGNDPAAPPTHFTAFGVAPNWARTVMAKVAGHQREIPVVRHAYVLRAEQPIEVQRLMR